MKNPFITLAGRFIFLAGIAGLFAFAISARNTEPGITFATQGIDLKIDSEASYNGFPVPSGTWDLKNLVPGVDKFFNFGDIKPGDFGENTISMHVGKSDAWLCLDFKNLTQNENSINEPESNVDGTTGGLQGELAAGMEFFGWVDDCDNIFEVGERPLFGTTTQSALQVLNNASYPIGDAKTGGSCKVNSNRCVGIFWCAGDLSVNTKTAEITCDGSALGNAAQTDSFSADVSIRALPSKENPKFLCGGVSPPPQTASGSIAGVVYHDKDKDYKRDAGEPGLSGWTIKLYKGVGWNTFYASAISDAQGVYIFPNLQNSSYSVEEIIQTGWNQITSDYRSVIVANGSAVINKNFGNVPKKK